MTVYRCPEARSGTMHLEGHGAVDYALPAGDVTPATPAEAAVLARLATVGLVSIVPASKNTDKKAGPPTAPPEPKKE